MARKTLDDIDLNNKIVLTRVDINVPVENGHVRDTTRIDRSVPTLQTILEKGGTPVMMAHFGRPKGNPTPDLSLRITLPALEAALQRPVVFLERPTRAQIMSHPQGTVFLLENTRFSLGEEENSPQMADFLASLGDIYCNDAFSTAHRAHASTKGIAHRLPSCAGRLMEAELSALEAALSNPKRPLTAVVGGAKVSTKIALLENLARKVDALIIGGGMANTFLLAQGYGIGISLAEPAFVETAQRIQEIAQVTGCQIILPQDVVIAPALQDGVLCRIVDVHDCPDDRMILDAGPKSIAAISTQLAKSKTLIWNGPLGAFEISPFDTATKAAAGKAAELTQTAGLVSVAGGGDTIAALNAAGVTEQFTYVSMAGGAFLEWMEGKTLPGVAALEG